MEWSDFEVRKGMTADLFYLFVVSVEDDVTSRAEENPGMKKKNLFPCHNVVKTT